MSDGECDCYQIGGPWIDVNPNCEIHRSGGLNDQVDELRTRIAELEAENKRLKDFALTALDYDPRCDIYASELHADAYRALGLCPCCGEVECEEES